MKPSSEEVQFVISEGKWGTRPSPFWLAIIQIVCVDPSNGMRWMHLTDAYAVADPRHKSLLEHILPATLIVGLRASREGNLSDANAEIQYAHLLPTLPALLVMGSETLRQALQEYVWGPPLKDK